MRPLTVSELARQLAVNPATVRYYERRGLLRPPSRSASGYRLYSADSVRRLRFIKHAQKVGFALKEVAQLLELADSKRSSATVCAVTRAKIEAVDEQIRQLRGFKRALQRLTDSCTKVGSTEDCAVIRHFYA